MRVLDSRRLRGRSLGSEGPAAVAEVWLDGLDAAAFEAAWRLQLARALGALQDEPDRAAEYGRTAFARARDRFTPDRMAAGHEAVYREARRSQT